MRIRRKTREQYRHERATVLQQKAADLFDALTPQQIQANKDRAAELAAQAKKRLHRENS